MSTLNELMNINPLDLNEDNLDALIDFHRKNRSKIELSGGRGRAKIARPDGEKKKIDLSTLSFGTTGLAPPKPKDPPLKRRF